MVDQPVSGSVAGVSVSSVPVQLIHRDYKLDIFDRGLYFSELLNKFYLKTREGFLFGFSNTKNIKRFLVITINDLNVLCNWVWCNS